MNCDGDLLIVHSPQQEKIFMENGFSEKINYIMHNYYILIGPKSDPAKISNLNVENALKKFLKQKALLFLEEIIRVQTTKKK